MTEARPFSDTGAALAGSNLNLGDLSDANLSNANLAGVQAPFFRSDLTDARFTNAIVVGASFGSATEFGFTKQQLYSTASYASKNLERLGLADNDLSAWDLIGQNVPGASLHHSNLTGPNFAGATVADVNFHGTTARGFTKHQLYSTASYEVKDLRGVALYDNDLKGWNFNGQNLTQAALWGADLSDADFTAANLSDADLYGSSLSRASFAGALVAAANFQGSNLTNLQLYSTRSYHDKDLNSVGLSGNDLSGWDLSRQNLSGADLSGSSLAETNLEGANISSGVLYSATLRNASLVGANLSQAILFASKLYGADLTGAIVAGADFSETTIGGFSSEQLYSTQSYEGGNLRGVRLSGNDLTGWSFAGQDLSDAVFGFRGRFGGSRSVLSGANLEGANLTNVLAIDTSMQNAMLAGAVFAGSQLTGADLRGATGFSPDASSATDNMIWPGGEVAGVDGGKLFVRNYLEVDSDPIPVLIQDQFKNSPLLVTLFDAAPWNSTIHFEPGIDVELGLLSLGFANGVEASTQAGNWLQLFDWTGVSPVGEFTVDSPYQWDLSRLYSTGEVRLLLAGDTNGDGLVNLEDLNNVRNNFGSSGLFLGGDTNGDRVVDLVDLNNVRNFFGGAAPQAVPEPNASTLALVGLASLRLPRIRRQFLRSSTIACLLVAAIASAAIAQPKTFTLQEASVADINEAFDSGVLTSERLVQLYLNRIDAYDDAGPQLNAFIALNSSALETARALDQERRTSGPRSPLHGILVVLKDNIDTFDMPTTYGCLALDGSVPLDDAFLVKRLRDAGAIVLGKTNLDEFGAGLIGRSSLGGQTRNAYDVSRVPLGSSGGTGVAVAANLATLGFGADAIGSVRMPSSASSLVGLKPTLGLISRDGIISYDVTREMAGPLARTVTDVAIALDVVAGYDPTDPTTAASQGHIPASYLDSLHVGSLQQAKFGKVPYVAPGRTNPMRDLSESAFQELQALGAELTGPVDVTFMPDWYSTLFDSFEYDLNRYLESLGPGAPVKSFDELVASGKYLPSLDGYFATVVRGDTPYSDDPVFLQLMSQRDSLRQQLIGIMDSQGLDALVYPTFPREPALTTVEDRVWTEDYFDNMTLAAFLGLPAITVPAGFTPEALPLGIEFLGRPFSEPTLLGFAYDYEQATKHRRPPTSTPSLVGETMVLGDTNFDGVVDLVDLNNVRNNFGAAGLGDTNGDQMVDLVDLNNVRNHFGESTPPAVPEPSSSNIAFVLVALLAGPLMRLRRRGEVSMA